MPAATTLAWLNAAVTAASMAYQYDQQRKAKAKAAAAAELRKGFEIVVDGEGGNVPFAYGRVKIGGFRVYKTTTSEFKYTAPNSDKVFLAGTGEMVAFNYDEFTYDGESLITTSVPVSATAGSYLNANKTGTKNEYLFFQQAIAIAPIQGIYDILINDEISFDDPILGTNVENTNSLDINHAKSAMRIDCHYDGRVDNIAKLNFANRANAAFPELAHTNCWFKINRDSPAFNSIPNVTFIMEGRKVYNVEAGALSASRTYSNNSPRVLLDYLMDKRGKKLSVSKIDLASFETAIALGERTVISNAIVGGKIWRPTDVSRNVERRNIKLFECNLVLDTGAKVRDNIDKILATMGDARLVWSQGKYKLQVQVPESNPGIVFAGSLTDTDIYDKDQIRKVWPSASDRLNSATVRFSNEFLDFREDSMSWPPKANSTVLKGVGGDPYPAVSDFNDDSLHGKLLNKYAVWSGNANTTALSWKFKVLTTGSHTLRWAVDENGTIGITGGAVSVSMTAGHSAVHTTTFNAFQNDILTVTVTASNSADLRGFSAEIIDSLSLQPWTTRSPAYTDFISYVETDTVYQAMLDEDNGVALDSDETLDGITDPYHALAKAEERVRMSRTAVPITFTYWMKGRFYEPGDIIELNSETLNISSLYLKVSECKVKSGGLAELSCTRFDYTQLAWNVADDVYIPPRSFYDFRIPKPEFINHTPVVGQLSNSAGALSWASVSDSRVLEYIIYVHEALKQDASGYPIFHEVGRSAGLTFELPALQFRTGLVGVRARTLTGMSEMRVSAPVVFSSRSLKITTTAFGFIFNELGIPLEDDVTLTATITGYRVPVFKWYLNDVLLSGETTKDLVILPFLSAANRKYTVKVDEAAYELTGETLLEDSSYLFSLEEGKSTLTLALSNDNHNIPATYLGVVTSLEGAATLAEIYRGDVAEAFGWAFTRTNSAGVTSTINGLTAVDAMVLGSAPTIVVTDFGAGIDSGYVDINATNGTLSLTKRFTLTKVKAGSTSFSTYSATIYKEGLSAPVAPTGGTFNFGTNTITPPAGWSATPPTVDELPVWQTSYLFSTETPSAPVTALTWPDPLLYGLPPLKTAQITIYKRAATTPTLPSATATYTYETSALTGLSEGWSLSIPAGADHLWASIVTSVNWTATDSIAAGEWSSPVQISGTGATGFSVSSVLLFRRTATSAAPALPAETLTFDFATTVLTGNLNGWAQSLPTSGGGYCWMTSATASAQAATDTISVGEWATPSMITTDGVPGTNATQSALAAIYQWATVEPALPVATSTYNWTTTEVTFSGSAAGWSNEVAENPGTPGIKLWAATRRLTATSTDTTTVFSWDGSTNIVYVSANGLDGAEGPAGPQAAIPMVYQWGLTIPTIVGTSTYTWATGGVSPVPSGWSALPAGGAPGETLWAARFQLIDSPSAVTSSIDWSSSSIVSIGYKGNDTGIQGDSARRAYVITTADTLGNGPVLSSGASSLPASTSSFGTDLYWSSTPTNPTPGTNEKLFQSDGLYSPITNVVTWSTPYISALKVGSLSALAVNTGSLTVNNLLTVGVYGGIVSGNFTGYAWPTPDGVGGYYIGREGLLFGNATSSQRIEITREGDMYAPGFEIVGGNASFSGNLDAASGTLGSIVVDDNGFIRQGQTGFNSGVGYFLGEDVDGNIKFSIGNASGSKLWIDHTGLYVEKMTFDAFTVAIPGGNTSTTGVSSDVILPARTVVVTGGSAPFTYTWVVLPTSNLVRAAWIYSGNDTATVEVAVSFYDPGFGGASATVRILCFVTDNNGRTTMAKINGTVNII